MRLTTMGHEMAETGAKPTLSLNPADHMRYAQPSAALAASLHVCRRDWHGILSATMALPGHKLLISDTTPAGPEIDALCLELEARGIRAICFQGYSKEAEVLARGIRARMGTGVRLYAVSHVTATQFQAPFEIRMQAALRAGLKDGTFNRLGSVKPHFHEVMPEVWPHTLINFCPALPSAAPAPAVTGGVLVPVENHWRKGLYTNLIAALRVPAVTAIHSVNAPNHLELLEDLSRVQVTGFLDRASLYALMGRVDAVMNVSLAECQPMTQLEAFAHGRPCLTGPLGLGEFAGDEIIERCTVTLVDTPTEARTKLADLTALWARDGGYVQRLIADHVSRRHALAERRYLDFLEL